MEVIETEQLNTFQQNKGVTKFSADGQSFRHEMDEEYIYLSDEALKKMLPVQIYQALRNPPSCEKTRGMHDEFLLRREFQDDSTIEPLTFEEMARAADLNILKNSIHAEKLTTEQIRKILCAYKKDDEQDMYEEKKQSMEDDIKRKRLE